eukprot:227601-Amphidinium_carterae.1
MSVPSLGKDAPKSSPPFLAENYQAHSPRWTQAKLPGHVSSRSRHTLIPSSQSWKAATPRPSPASSSRTLP